MNATAVGAIGDLSLDPQRRQLRGPSGAVRLQPQALAVFEMLAGRPGAVASRADIFTACWGGAAVGDDSLNRIVSQLRRALGEVGARRVRIETVPHGGYALTVNSDVTASPPSDACEPALSAWRLGAPVVDSEAISGLERRLLQTPKDYQAWGWLALLCAKAAEYAPAEMCEEFIRRCETAAHTALDDPAGRALGEIALARLTPIFGNWLALRRVLEAHGENPVAQHELAVLEMSTGRVSAAVPLVEQLLAADPLAAQLHYKRMYHLWSLGKIAECERVSLSALQLWPRHSAIWFARFWILLGTGRAEQAGRLAAEGSDRPPLPEAAFAFLRAAADFAACGASEGEGTAIAERAFTFAATGPANAVAALLALCALDDLDSAFGVADGYYLGRGPAASPARPGREGMSVSDQHRRVTQPLFLPISAAMRADARFRWLCEEIGLAGYWSAAALEPDFRTG